MTRRRVSAALWTAVLLLAPASAYPAEWDQAEPAENVRLVQGLRERRLFTLAESFCVGRLEESSVDPIERGDLMVALLQTYADHALHSDPAARGPLWDAARVKVRDFQRRFPDNPRAFLIQLQEALGALAHARLARQEAEVGGGEDAMDEPRRLTRAAIGLLETLLRELETEVPRRRRANNLRPGDLSADALFAIQNNTFLQLGEAYENQALCYPEGSDDRIAALTIALEHLAEPLKQIPSGDPLIDQIRLRQAVCLRLRGDRAQAEQLLAAVQANPKAAALHPLAVAELARVRLSQNRLREAGDLLEKAASADADLDFARLETIAMQIKQAGDSPTAGPLRKQAITMVRALEENHGPYWGRRASQLLVRIAGDAEGGAGLEILRRTAESLYLKGDLPAAIEAYDQAAERADTLGREDDAFKHRVTAAMIEQKQDRPKAYLQRMRDIGMKMQSHPQAGDAHLGAISMCIQLARQDAAELERYEELLREHIDSWPQRDTAHQCRIWLGKLLVSRKQWSEAISVYSAIPEDSDQFGTAVRAVAPCWQTHLANLTGKGQDSAKAAEQAIAYFEALPPKDANGDAWSELDRIAALQAARTRILYREGDSAIAERLLVTALQSSPDAESSWTRTARAWLVVALGAQGRVDEAARWIGELAGANPSDLYDVVVQLHVFLENAPQDKISSLLAIETEAIRILRPHIGRFSETKQRQLALIIGESLLRGGKVKEAQQQLRQLAQENPRNGQVQEAYARSLSANPQDAGAALEQWRRVDAGSRRETERWYRAKFYVARAYYDLGQKKAAADRIRYLQQTSKMDTPLRDAFVQLLKECQQR